VLGRIADLMNIILSQRVDIFEIKSELSHCKSELSSARQEIAELKAERPQTSVFEFGGHKSRSPNSGSKQSSATIGSPATLAPPAIVVNGRSRSRSTSAKRKRSSFFNRECALGTADVTENCVPVVQRVNKKRVFISRIAPNFSAEAMFKAVKPKIKRTLSVVRLKTLHSSYSSFCLYVEEEDEKTVPSPQF